VANQIKEKDVIKEFEFDKKNANKTLRRMVKEGTTLLKIQYILHILYNIIKVLVIIGYIIGIPIWMYYGKDLSLIIIYLMTPIILAIPVILILIIFVKIFRFEKGLYTILPIKQERVIISKDKIGIATKDGMYMVVFNEIRDIEYNNNFITIYAPCYYTGTHTLRQRNGEMIYIKKRGIKLRIDEEGEKTKIKIYNYYSSYNEIWIELKNRVKKI